MNIVNYNKPRNKLEKFKNSNYSTMTNIMNLYVRAYIRTYTCMSQRCGECAERMFV